MQDIKSTPNTKLKVFKLNESAVLPTSGSQKAAGVDLYALKSGVIPPDHKFHLVSTGIAVIIPEGHYGRIAPRSGLALKKSIDVGGGVIDGDYRGDVGVLLANHSGVDFKYEAGTSIAQLILEKISYAEIEQVFDLDQTARGSGGFGSTGITPPTKSDTSPAK